MCYFSIVIPVYQAEDMLARCVKSVVEQTCKDWELILVDDGSKDGSQYLCDEFHNADNRIVSIHKENGGAASARNMGVARARGTYILFMDADDYWEDVQFLDELKNVLVQEPDICLYGCYDEDAQTGNRVLSRGRYPMDREVSDDVGSVLFSLFAENQFPSSCWIMAVNKSFLQLNSISFQEGNRAEDIDWLLQVLVNVKTIGCINMAPYIYIKNQNSSITGTAGEKSIISILETVGKWNEIIAEIEDRNTYMALNSYLLFEYLTAIILYGKLSKKKRDEYRKMFYSISLHWKDVLGKKMIVCGIVYRFFGVGFTSYLLNLWRSLK